jgi:hypothetical protein
MSLRSFFKKAVNDFSLFLEKREVASLKETIETARKGQGYVAARGGVVKVQVSPEKAKFTLDYCYDRLDEIERKRRERNAPKP